MYRRLVELMEDRDINPYVLDFCTITESNRYKVIQSQDKIKKEPRPDS